MARYPVTIDPELEPIMGRYLALRRAELDRLDRALAEEDFSAAVKLGHILKGSGGSYGFDRLTELGAAIEAAARERDGAAAGRLAAEVRDFIDNVDINYGE